jgi:hypothetical protein
MNPRREFLLYLLAQFTISLGIFWLANASWQTTLTDTITENLGTTIRMSGTDFVPLLSISAIVSIIALLGVIATGLVGRRIIGITSTAIALAAFVSVFFVQGEGVFGWLAVAGVLLFGLIVTNTFEVVRCPAWPQLGGKYERNSLARSQEETARDPWKSLDNGIDPTLD